MSVHRAEKGDVVEPVITPRQEAWAQMKDWKAFPWANLFSLRFIWCSGLLTILVFILPLGLLTLVPGFGWVEPVLDWLFLSTPQIHAGSFEMPWLFIILWGLVVWILLADGAPTRCSACGKRMKLGFPVCHHCGYDTEGVA